MEQSIRANAIVSLVQGVHKKSGQLGKIQLQKLVYFLQESGMPLNYKFEIYHYGPYSFELADEMSALDSRGVLSVAADTSGYGFDINTGSYASKYKTDKRYLPKIDDVISKFGEDTPAELEVKSTLHFVHKVLKKHQGTPSEKLVLSKVKELKPRFSDKFISNCFQELKGMRMVS